MTGRGAALAGEVAIVSGGLGDIGRAIAVELAARGAHVALGDIGAEDAAASLLADLRGHGVRASYQQVDVRDGERVRQWVDGVAADLGTADLVVPAAATVISGGVLDLVPQEWSDALHVNLTGAFHLASAAVRRLRGDGRPGRVVFVGSWAAHAPHPGITSYSVGKAALRMLCRCMALELAPHGILVNEVAPGYVDAGLSKQIFDANPGRREEATARVPLGALHTAAEVARLVASLCTTDTSGVTGSTLVVDGGLSLLTTGDGRA